MFFFSLRATNIERLVTFEAGDGDGDGDGGGEFHTRKFVCFDERGLSFFGDMSDRNVCHNIGFEIGKGVH